MFDVQHSKQPEHDRTQAAPAQKTSETKQHTEDLTRIPLYTQLAWDNQPPPWLRLPIQQKKPHEKEALPEKDEPPTQYKENMTGLPDTLKAGIEQLSGLSMDDVQVHYNSARPAEVQALAYTQGTEIHVGPGQKDHLPHEAWHVVQQKQGRVQPTLQTREVTINDDQVLENEADVMGKRASVAQRKENTSIVAEETVLSSRPPLQLRIAYYKPKDESLVPLGLTNMNKMAKQLDTTTETAHGYVVGKLQLAETGAYKLDKKDFPASSDRRFNDWLTRLNGSDDSLKAAVTGYIIEDIVTAVYGSAAGYTPQFGTGGAIPDFLLVDGGYRGVVDITSTGDIAHVLRKNFSIQSFDYVVESLYPRIDFANIDTTAMQVSDETINMVGKIRAIRATEVLIHELGIIRGNLDLILSAGLAIYSSQVTQAAGRARSLVTSMISNKYSIPSLRQDLDKELQIIKTSQNIVTIRKLVEIITEIEDKYSVTGNPPWG